MNTKKINLVLCEENVKVKITRFFEVTNYLTENNLWSEVEKILLDSEVIGPKIIVDKNLANAVKLVMARHASNTQESLDEKGILSWTIRCGSMRTPHDR